MSIRPIDELTNVDPVSADYPNGEYRDDTVTGDKTGTPLVASTFNDIQGFTDALLADAGITPNGTPDTALSSDRLRAIRKTTVRTLSSIYDPAFANIKEGETVYLKEYHPGSGVGGGHGERKLARHNGGTAISLDRPRPVDWSGNLTAWFADSGADELCWMRTNLDYCTLEMFGAKSDWDGSTGTNIKLSFDAFLQSGIKRLASDGNPYYFGAVGEDQTLFTITNDLLIDFGGSLLVVDGDNTTAGTAACLFSYYDSVANIKNYSFIDTNFDHDGPSRGVQPCAIVSDTKTTYNHKITGFNILAGQSALTIDSVNPLTARASGIELDGVCEQVYYGINAAGNGDNINFNLTIQKCFRAYFIYDNDTVNGIVNLAEGLQSSGQGIVANSGGTAEPSKNIDISVHVGVLNGPFLLTDTAGITSGTGRYRNVKIKASFDSMGSNITEVSEIFKIGDGTASSSDSTIDMDDIEIDLSCTDKTLNFINPIVVKTPSSNYGRFKILGNLGYRLFNLYPKNSSGVAVGPLVYDGYGVRMTAYGDLTNALNVVKFPVALLATRRGQNPFGTKIKITASNNTPNVFLDAEYSVIGQSLSDFTAFPLFVSEIYKHASGGVTPVVTIELINGASEVKVSIDSYSNAFAEMTVTVVV